MDMLKKAAQDGKVALNKDQPGAQKQGGIDFTDGVQASDVKGIAGGKDGINLKDGVDMKDAQGAMKAFQPGGTSGAGTGAAQTGAPKQ